MKNIYQISLTLDKILKKLDVINAKLTVLPQVQVQVSNRFLPTFISLTKLGSGTATQLSSITGRTKAVESKNLNEMYSMGLLNKERQGRKQVFIPLRPSFLAAQELTQKSETAEIAIEKIMSKGGINQWR
jgi:hypothetical protein